MVLQLLNVFLQFQPLITPLPNHSLLINCTHLCNSLQFIQKLCTHFLTKTGGVAKNNTSSLHKMARNTKEMKLLSNAGIKEDSRSDFWKRKVSQHWQIMQQKSRDNWPEVMMKEQWVHLQPLSQSVGLHVDGITMATCARSRPRTAPAPHWAELWPAVRCLSREPLSFSKRKIESERETERKYRLWRMTNIKIQFGQSLLWHYWEELAYHFHPRHGKSHCFFSQSHNITLCSMSV